MPTGRRKLRITTGLVIVVTLVFVAARLRANATPPIQVQATPPVQTPTPSPTPTPIVPAGPADYIFSTGAGLVFYYVRTARVTDFEAILDRIKDALGKADAPMLKQQALNWKIYKSAEPATDATVFVFAFDPAITTANYDPLLVLSQVLPAEVQPLYDRLKESVIKVERMGLTKIR